VLGKAFVSGILSVFVHHLASDEVDALIGVFVLGLVHRFLAVLAKMLHRR
jgi:hypothetical protein